MGESPSEDRPPDASADRAQMRLQCIGSFSAHTAGGETHVIEIWTHFGAMHDRARQRVTPTLLVLTTQDGRGVDRIAQGEYCFHENPDITLSTDDPSAP